MVVDSEDFDDLFSGLPERDEEAFHEAVTELTVGDLRGVVATVSLIEDQLVSLRTPDGSSVTVFNDLYPELRLGDPVMVYPDGSGGWSLACSAWWIPADFDQGEPRRSYGSLLDFVPQGVDDARDALVGTINGIDAEMARSDHMGFARSPVYSLESDVGRKLRARVADPRQRPIRLCADLSKGFTRLYQKSSLWSDFLGEDELYWRAGHFLLALLELLEHRSSLPAKVVSVELDTELSTESRGLEVELYGVRLPIRDSLLAWPTDLGEEPVWCVGETIAVEAEIDLAADWLMLRLVSRSDPEWRQLQESFPAGCRVLGSTITPEAVDSTTRGLQRRGVLVEVHGKATRVFALVPYGELTRGNDPYHYDLDSLTDGELEVIGYDEAGPRLLLSRARCLPRRAGQFSRGELVPVMTRSYREMLLAYWDWGHVAVLPKALEEEVRLFSWLRVAAMGGDRLIFDRVVNRRSGRLFETREGERAVRLDDATSGALRKESLATLGEEDEFGLSDVRFSSSGPVITLESCQGRLGTRMWAKVVRYRDYRLILDLYGEKAVVKTILWRRALKKYVDKPLDVVVTEVTDDGGIVVESSLILEEQNRLLSRSRGRLDLIDPENFVDPWEEVEAAHENGQDITGRVLNRIRGGFSVDIGLIAFLPFSLADIRPVQDDSSLLGQELQFRIISLDVKSSNVVLSRKAVLDRELAMIRAETLDRLQESARLEGRVKNINDYGVFVDLGGVDGLLHINDISWGRVKHPSDHFSIGEPIEVVVLKVDLDTERISLGYKQRTEDPWIRAQKKYTVGSRVKSTVVSLVDYGAFVELEEGVEGLIHVSEMSWTKKTHKSYKRLARAERLQIGDEVEAIICELDAEQRRISLSLRQTQRNPWLAFQDAFPVDSIVEGRVRNLTAFGAFVELTDEIDGLIHISDMSWVKQVKHPIEVLTEGDWVKARITDIDVDGQRVSLSIKEFLPNEWENFNQEHEVGDTIEGTIVNVTDFGLFVDIFQGLEGLAHVSEVDLAGGQLKDRFKIGDGIGVRILRIEEEDKKVGLTMLGVVQPEPSRVVAEDSESSEVVAEDSESSEDDGQGQNGDTASEVEVGQEASGAVVPFVVGKTSYNHFCSQLRMKRVQLEAALQLTIPSEEEFHRPLTYEEFQAISNTLRAKRRVSTGPLPPEDDPKEPLATEPISWEHRVAQARVRVGDIVPGQITAVETYLSIQLADGVECHVEGSEIDLPELDVDRYAQNWVRLTDHYRVGDWVRVRILRIEASEHRIVATVRGVAQPDETEWRELHEAAATRGAAEADAESAPLKDVPVSLE